jgi:hypothetical protein
MSRHTRTRRAASVIAISFALTVLFIAPANAADPTMTASLKADGVVNGPANAGKQTTFSLEVKSNQGQLRNLSLAAPAGFYVASASSNRGNASVSGDATNATVNVSGVNLSGQTQAIVTITAYPNCTSPGTGTWNLSAFGNGTTYVPLTFSTTVTTPSSCKLVFGSIADQQTNVASSVTVAAVRANNSKDTGFADTVRLAIENDPGDNDAALTGGDPTALVDGEASFSVSLSFAGYGYVLEACSTNLGGLCTIDDGLGFRSLPFAVYDSVFVCGNNGNCSANGNGHQVTTQVSATAQGGKTIKAGVYAVPQAVVGGSSLGDLDCAGYDEITEEVTTFGWDGDGVKFVTNVISADQMKEIANNGVSYLQTCFASSLPFTDRFNNPAVQVPSLGVIPGGLYVGLLKDCPANKKNLTQFAPCIVSRQGGGTGTGSITYVAKIGDPGGARH